MKIEKKTGEVHPKGWGHELWIENNDLYCGKMLHFNKGKMCSLHYHKLKTETMHLQSGHLQIKFIDDTKGEYYVVDMFPGDNVFIPAGTVHQIAAVEDSDLYEFSTTHRDSDSYRIERGD